MSPAFGNPTGTFAQQSQNQPQPTNTMQQPFGGQQQGGFGGQQQGGFGGQQGGLSGMFGGFGGQQGGFGMPQMQSPYGPQQGGFGGGFGGMDRSSYGGGFQPQMQSPYGPQMGGFGGYGQQMGGFGGYGQQMGGFGGGMGGGFNPYQQGMMGGFGGMGGFNPYQMQSPYGPQMGGYGGGFGGGMGGFGRGRGMGRGRDRMVGNQGMGGYGRGFDDMSYTLQGTPQSPENMPPQYGQENMVSDMRYRGGKGDFMRQQFQEPAVMNMAMPQPYDHGMADFEHVMRNVNSGAAQNRLGGGANAIAQDQAVQNAFQAQRMA